jgi:hypothetical protein
VTPLIIRSSKTVIAASGFTYVCGCRQLSWLSGNFYYTVTSCWLFPYDSYYLLNESEDAEGKSERAIDMAEKYAS